MPRVKFTRHLQRFFPDLDEVEIAGESVAEVIAGLEARYPGLTDYPIDEQGALRQHVNVFIGKDLIRDREHLQDPIADDDRLFIKSVMTLSIGMPWTLVKTDWLSAPLRGISSYRIIRARRGIVLGTTFPPFTQFALPSQHDGI